MYIDKILNRLCDQIYNIFLFSDELLMDFLDYYSSFDFGSKGISILHGITTKPETDGEVDAVYLENPIDRDLNAGKTIITEKIEEFKTMCKQSHDTLKAEVELGRDYNRNWGLLSVVDVDCYKESQSDEDGEVTTGAEPQEIEMETETGNGLVLKDLFDISDKETSDNVKEKEEIKGANEEQQKGSLNQS